MQINLEVVSLPCECHLSLKDLRRPPQTFRSPVLNTIETCEKPWRFEEFPEVASDHGPQAFVELAVIPHVVVEQHAVVAQLDDEIWNSGKQGSVLLETCHDCRAGAPLFHHLTDAPRNGVDETTFFSEKRPFERGRTWLEVPEFYQSNPFATDRHGLALKFSQRRVRRTLVGFLVDDNPTTSDLRVLPSNR